MSNDIHLREATGADLDAVWPIFHEVVSACESYALDPQTDRDGARQFWFDAPLETWVAEDQAGILGSYYLKPNQAGPGSHVCNCGYMTASRARGRGIATLMCEHSQERAVALGFKAMQFNHVVASNEGAIRLWHKLGYQTVGRLPGAFHHPERGYIDALVMYKWLDGEPPA